MSSPASMLFLGRTMTPSRPQASSTRPSQRGPQALPPRASSSTVHTSSAIEPRSGNSRGGS
eukprot:7588934-Lingulodinium_polyedra.AAC.1